MWLPVWMAMACGAPAPDRTRRAGGDTGEAVDHLGGNVLVILVDDLGIDHLGVYGVQANTPPTPTIDGLAAEGVLFRNAWAHPTCSPTRATLLTGRYPRRHGIGKWIFPAGQSVGLDPDEVLIPEVLRLAPERWEDAYIGKWHLTGFLGNPDPAADPLVAGFSYHAGTLGNPQDAVNSSARARGYGYWEKATQGELAFHEGYLTTDTTDDAIERVRAMSEPWFMVVAYNAPHQPWHIPPPELHSYDLDPATASIPDRFDAMIEALDTEMGRLLAAVEPEVRARTTVVFMSDNGTPKEAVRPPLEPLKSKGTVFEGGVNVPLIVTGPAVTRPGSESLALVEAVDLLPTVAEIAGVSLSEVTDPVTGAPVELDGISFLPHVRDPDLPSRRVYAYTSKHEPNGAPPYAVAQDAIRDERYKLAYHTEHGTWFFEYQRPFDEGPELLSLGPLTEAQQAAYDRLDAALWERVGALTPAR